MDSETPEQAKLDETARRARTILILVTAVLIVVPAIAFLLFGKAAAPTP